jgi:hypothetical protein
VEIRGVSLSSFLRAYEKDPDANSRPVQPFLQGFRGVGIEPANNLSATASRIDACDCREGRRAALMLRQ